MKEKRHFQRVMFSVPGEIWNDTFSSQIEIIDLSLNGVLITVPPKYPLVLNSKFNLKFHLPDTETQIAMELIAKHIEPHYIGASPLSIDIESMGHLKKIIELNTGNIELLKRELHELIEIHMHETK